jgi:hypothetical protein
MVAQEVVHMVFVQAAIIIGEGQQLALRRP